MPGRFLAPAFALPFELHGLVGVLHEEAVLRVAQFLVLTVFDLDKLVVVAALGDLTVAHYHDAVGVADGGQSVRDYEAGAAAQQYLQRVLNQQLDMRIDGRRGLVEDQYLGVIKQRARANEISRRWPVDRDEPRSFTSV